MIVKPSIIHFHKPRKQAFTMLELMVAIVILVIAMSIAFQAFSGVVRAWKRGTEVANGIKHGDYVINQLEAALNSSIYFYNNRKAYAFIMEKDYNGGFPSDVINFVTSNSAFIPANSPYIDGPHRIKLFIDSDENGDPGLYIIPMPAIADPEEYEDEFDAEPILISRMISGLEILFWDAENEDWTDEWEPENSIPERIQITVFVESADRTEEPMIFTRVINIPVFDSVELRLSSPSSTGNNNSPNTRNTGNNRNTGNTGTAGPGNLPRR